LNTKICATCNIEKDINEFYAKEKYSKTKGQYLYIPPECKECTKKRSSTWTKNNPERKREKNNQYYKEGRWNQIIKDSANRQRKDGYFKVWGKSNKDKLKYYSEKRKVKNHKISNKEWKACKEYFNDSCAYCGMHISEHFNTYAGELKHFDFHREHVDDQGANDLSNCVPSCKSCNSEKHTSKLSDWYNSNNPKFSSEREVKILKWLESDYEMYIKLK
jgi:hypothetical protein